MFHFKQDLRLFQTGRPITAALRDTARYAAQ